MTNKITQLYKYTIKYDILEKTYFFFFLTTIKIQRP